MRFAIESWAPEYGTSADETQLVEPGEQADPTVERPLSSWEPLTPSHVDPPARLLFVDGVRRIDARVWFDDDGITRPGVCATVAAGSVLCEHRSATVHDVTVARGVFTRASDAASSIDTAHGAYEWFACNGDTPEDLYLRIHQEMTALESTIAESHDADLVVFDGPLRGRHDPLAVGYVKTQHVQYLPDAVQPVLGRLGAGQRSPLFLIGGRSSSRFSWYLRLPGAIAQPMSGIVRCEILGRGSVADAVQRADQISVTLPRFASEAHKDPRAPQNLYPIAGLERELRRRLGDPQLLERALRRAAAA